MKVVRKKSRNGRWSHVQDAQVVYRWKFKKMTPQQMAEDMGWSIQVIRDSHKRLGLEPHRLSSAERAQINGKNAAIGHERKRSSSTYRYAKPEPAFEPLPNDMGCVQQAEAVLYGRFSVRNGERYLLGERVPCSIDRFMREANKLRKDAGLPPLGRNQAWHV